MTERRTHADPSVQKAAMWLADETNPPHPVIAHLREQFGLSALQASQACALAQTYRMLRKAHG